MKVTEKGHQYELDQRVPEHGEGRPPSVLTFVNKEPGREHAGTTTQEVLRALIDRTRHCNNCLPHPNNERAVYHLRMALVLHEARALERKTEKGEFAPEFLHVGQDGHFKMATGDVPPNSTMNLEPYRQDWDRECKHPPAPDTSRPEDVLFEITVSYKLPTDRKPKLVVFNVPARNKWFAMALGEARFRDTYPGVRRNNGRIIDIAAEPVVEDG